MLRSPRSKKRPSLGLRCTGDATMPNTGLGDVRCRAEAVPTPVADRLADKFLEVDARGEPRVAAVVLAQLALAVGETR